MSGGGVTQAAHHPHFPLQGKVYIVGGVGGGGTRASGEEEATRSAVTVAGDAPPPGIVKGSASVAPTSDSFSHTSSVYVYDVAAAEWSFVRAGGTPPPPRSSLTAVAVGRCIFVHGGEGPEVSARARAARSSAGDSMRSASRGPVAARAGLVGADDTSPPLELFGDVHVLDTATMMWTAARPNAVIADFSEDLLASSLAPLPASSREGRRSAPPPLRRRRVTCWHPPPPRPWRRQTPGNDTAWCVWWPPLRPLCLWQVW